MTQVTTGPAARLYLLTSSGLQQLGPRRVFGLTRALLYQPPFCSAPLFRSRLDRAPNDSSQTGAVLRRVHCIRSSANALWGRASLSCNYQAAIGGIGAVWVSSPLKGSSEQEAVLEEGNKARKLLSLRNGDRRDRQFGVNDDPATHQSGTASRRPDACDYASRHFPSFEARIGVVVEEI